MSSLFKSTKKRSIPAKSKDPIELIIKIEPKNAAYGLDEPTGENFTFKGDSKYPHKRTRTDLNRL